MARILEVQEVSDGSVRLATAMTKDGNLKRSVIKLEHFFNESVFGEKTRAGNVGASQLQDSRVKIERDW